MNNQYPENGGRDWEADNRNNDIIVDSPQTTYASPVDNIDNNNIPDRKTNFGTKSPTSFFAQPGTMAGMKSLIFSSWVIFYKKIEIFFTNIILSSLRWDLEFHFVQYASILIPFHYDYIDCAPSVKWKYNAITTCLCKIIMRSGNVCILLPPKILSKYLITISLWCASNLRSKSWAQS